MFLSVLHEGVLANLEQLQPKVTGASPEVVDKSFNESTNFEDLNNR